MTGPEADGVVVLAKDLFPKTTPGQGSAMHALVFPFPDPAYVRDLLKRLATETAVLPIPYIRADLEGELRRRGLTSEHEAKAREAREQSAAVQYWDRVERLIADLSDADLADLAVDALASLSADARWIEERKKNRNPRHSKLLKSKIYDRLVGAVRAEGVPKLTAGDHAPMLGFNRPGEVDPAADAGQES